MHAHNQPQGWKLAWAIAQQGLSVFSADQSNLLCRDQKNIHMVRDAHGAYQETYGILLARRLGSSKSDSSQAEQKEVRKDAKSSSTKPICTFVMFMTSGLQKCSKISHLSQSKTR